MSLISGITNALGFGSKPLITTAPKPAPISVAPGAQSKISTAQPMMSSAYAPKPIVKAPVVTKPVVAAPVQAPVQSPFVPQNLVQGNQAVASSYVPLPATSTPFSLDTSNITSDHLAGDNTPSSVLNYRNQLQQQYQAYQQAQQPLQQQYAQTSLFSPDEIQARQNVLDLNNGLAAGLEDLRGQGVGAPLTVVRGNQEKLQNQTALRQSAAANTLSALEAIRTNSLGALQSQIGFNQQNYTNQFGAMKEGQDASIAQGQLENTQLQTALSQYDYQQVMTQNGYPVISVIDKLTGQEVGRVNPSSDQGQAIVQSGGLTKGNGVINGYNISSYATDPQHEANVGGIYNGISQAVGHIQNAQQAQAVISSLAPKSPISGEMILASAQKYGVDPNLMIALMQQDSNLGTAGKAVKTFNPGNVGNTDSGATVNYGNWPAGVDAVAQWLSTHKQQGSNAEIANLPPILQQYVVQGPDSSYYINEDKVAPAQQNAVKIQAAQNGVPFLSGDEVSKIRSIDVTKQNLDQLEGITSKILSNGLGGRIIGLTTNRIKNYLQSDKDIASFNSFRDTAINTIQALAGGTGSGLRLNAGEIETAVGNLPTINDNLETANRKIELVRGFLDKWTKVILPNAQQGGTQAQGDNNDPLGLGF